MEKLSSTPRRLVLGGAVVGLVIAVALFIETRGTGSSTEEPATPRPAAPTAEPKVVKSSTPSDPNLTPVIRPPMSPDEIIAEVLKKDEQLAQFRAYHNVVLLDGPRRDEYRKLLSDPDMMNAMAEGLMSPGSGPAEPEEHYHRLMQIDYFEAALNWKDNPKRAEVLATTGKIIAHDNFRNDQPGDRRQMLAGGKMELYRMMYDQDDKKTNELVASARGTSMEKLVGWMSEENLRRRGREEDIRKEMAALQAKE
jgi:hypothetical protein